MEQRHETHPKWICKTFHSFADVPDQAVTVCQIPRIAHGDHGIVEKNVILCIFELKTAGFYIPIGIVEKEKYQEAEEYIAKEPWIHGRKYNTNHAIIFAFISIFFTVISDLPDASFTFLPEKI